jgi:outer membrane receptor protein involved in Fe transport
MGFYVSVEPGTDDLIVGNPQLGLSEVTSWDARAEYSWGDLGDLVAVSVFKKAIENPIESILVRNPVNLSGSSNALFRTFFNNPSRGSLRGIEAEARKLRIPGARLRSTSVGVPPTSPRWTARRPSSRVRISSSTAEGDRTIPDSREPASLRPAGMDRERRFHF